MTALALMGLVDFPGRVRARRMQFDGRDLLSLSAASARALTGKDIAMIFQDPLASLNPCFTVAFQLMEDAAHARYAGGARQRQAAPRAGAANCCSRWRSPTPRRGSTPIRTSFPAAWRSA